MMFLIKNREDERRQWLKDLIAILQREARGRLSIIREEDWVDQCYGNERREWTQRK